MNQELAGQVALVTGAASGIGAETAKLLTERGASVFAAAVVNQRFRRTLLMNPAKALLGYGNERFDFTPAERELILSIRAATLEEFADQVQELAKESESATE